MLITKKAILSVLPIFKSELLGYCPTTRHLKRLNRILANLVKKDRVKETRTETEEKNADGEIVKLVTIHYA